MEYTSPRTWVTGETVTASQLNTHLRDNMIALRAALTTRVYRSTALSTSTGTAVLVGMDAETTDSPGWHSTSSNTDRITPNLSGLYLVMAGASFAASATGYREVTLWRNGLSGQAIASIGRGIACTGSVSNNLAVSGVFTANGSTDYFGLGVEQSSGGALNVNGGEFLTWLSVTFLGSV